MSRRRIPPVIPPELDMAYELIKMERRKPGSREALTQAIRVEINRSNRCWYCGRTMGPKPRGRHFADSRTWDHVMPLSRGGEDKPKNKVLCCHGCNNDKADRTLEEYRAAKGGCTFWGERERARLEKENGARTEGSVAAQSAARVQQPALPAPDDARPVRQEADTPPRAPASEEDLPFPWPEPVPFRDLAEFLDFAETRVRRMIGDVVECPSCGEPHARVELTRPKETPLEKRGWDFICPKWNALAIVREREVRNLQETGQCSGFLPPP